MQEQGLKVSLLASGSSGNATYIETPKQKNISGLWTHW